MGQNREDLRQHRNPLDIFEGLAPNQMHGLLYSPFDTSCSPLIINHEIERDLVSQAPLFNHVSQFLNLLLEQQPLKLTQKGNLPRSFCRDLCDIEIVEHGISIFKDHPIMKETDSYYINMINLLTQLCGLTRKKQGRIATTKKCVNYLQEQSSPKLFIEMFLHYAQRFNWGYSDRYPEAWIIQGGFAFSILLVQRHGTVPRTGTFYSERFLRAFPEALNEFPATEFSSSEEYFTRCYYLRTVERFLHRFGLIRMNERSDFPSPLNRITKTQLLDDFIGWNL